MRPCHVSDALDRLIKSGRALFVWGPPAIGKSSLVHQLGARMGLPVLDFRLLYRQPVDLLGLPSIENGRTHFNPPADFPMDGEGIFFLDELGQSERSTIQVASQIALERRCGDARLGDGWRVIAASNRQEDRAGVGRLPSNLLSRFIHLDVDVSVEDWMGWAVENRMKVPVRGYLNMRPKRLHFFDPTVNARSFPAPRSWHAVSDVLDLTPPELRLEVFSGIVGPGDAAEFLAYLSVHDSLPDLDQLLVDPARARVPSESSVLYALATALPEKLRPQTGTMPPLEAFSTYALRLPKEYTALALRDGGSINRGLLSVPQVAKWCKDNHYMLAS